jgi:hypothetical protein
MAILLLRTIEERVGEAYILTRSVGPAGPSTIVCLIPVRVASIPQRSVPHQRQWRRPVPLGVRPDRITS